ncbi:MAG: hypothetical protein CMN28_10040 [Salinisphaeraceae bacterium]|nr:hypothetical protein [Salinisphaeraceae bacterium]
MLHRDVFPGGGPYLEFYSFHEPIFFPYGAHARRPQRGSEFGLFFEFGDDLLGSICGATGLYSPFGPHEETYYVPTLKNFRNRARAEGISVQRIGDDKVFHRYYGLLCELQQPIERWRATLAHVHGNSLRRYFKGAYEEYPGTASLRYDLLATMDFFLEAIEEANRQGKTISVIGF